MSHDHGVFHADMAVVCWRMLPAQPIGIYWLGMIHERLAIKPLNAYMIYQVHSVHLWMDTRINSFFGWHFDEATACGEAAAGAIYRKPPKVAYMKMWLHIHICNQRWIHHNHAPSQYPRIYWPGALNAYGATGGCATVREFIQLLMQENCHWNWIKCEKDWYPMWKWIGISSGRVNLLMESSIF